MGYVDAHGNGCGHLYGRKCALSAQVWGPSGDGMCPRAVCGIRGGTPCGVPQVGRAHL